MHNEYPKKTKIQLIGFPTNIASSGGDCALTPEAFRQIVYPHLKNKYGVDEKFLMVEVSNKTSSKKNSINNYDSVYNSVKNLFTEECICLWSGAKPVVIGGDHAQGLSTVKAGLFTSVLRNLLSENSKILPLQAKIDIRKFADQGDFISAASKLNYLARLETSIRKEIKRIINKIHIIWIDAHGDFNTKNTSDSGNFHGMSLAAACGLDAGKIEDIGGRYIRANPCNVHIMCARDLDEDEEKLMNKFGVDFERFEMHDTQKGKIRAKGQPVTERSREFNFVFTELVREIKNKNGQIILSMDIDHLPFPETGTPLGSEDNIRKNRFNKSPAGPSPIDTYTAYSNIASDESFIAFDITEIGLSYISSKTGKKIYGAKAFRGGVNILGSLLGGDEARLKLFKALKKEGNLVIRFKELAL